MIVVGCLLPLDCFLIYCSVVLDLQLETVEMPWHVVALLIALVRLVLRYRSVGTAVRSSVRTDFRRVRYVCDWLQHQGLSCPLTSYSDGKYFNTIEKVTIAYEVSIYNTTAILCC